MTDKKYTAQQYAAMYGGHSVDEEKKMNLQLVNELTESRLFRTKKISSEVDVDDAADLSFMLLMLLNVFNKDYDFSPLAGDYARRTIAFKGFDTFRTSGTDLYVSLNRLMGKDQKYEDEKNKIAIKRINLQKADLIRYLNHIGQNKTQAGFESMILYRFQRQLNIQDGLLKSIRRLVGDWDNLNQNQRALVVTRMAQFMRQRAMRSELTPALLKFQKRGNYVVNDKQDTKKKVWDNPIVKVAAVGAGIYGARKLGSYMGRSSYNSGGNLGKKFQSRDK